MYQPRSRSSPLAEFLEPEDPHRRAGIAEAGWPTRSGASALRQAGARILRVAEFRGSPTACVFPFESIASFKLDKVIGQATVFPGGLYSSAFGFFMNEDKWNKISKQDQEIIEKHSYDYAAR